MKVMPRNQMTSSTRIVIQGAGLLNGNEFFAMRADGNELRQLTDTRGAELATSGPSAELPAPYAYPGYLG
jgi:hypothetical protein